MRASAAGQNAAACGPAPPGQAGPAASPPAGPRPRSARRAGLAPAQLVRSPQGASCLGLAHGHLAATPPPPEIPLPDGPGSRRHPPQHLPFAKRVPNPTPRLWTSDPGRGDPDQVIALVGFPTTNGAAAAPTCNVHNLWINLLISMWGREVNGQ